MSSRSRDLNIVRVWSEFQARIRRSADRSGGPGAGIERHTRDFASPAGLVNERGPRSEHGALTRTTVLRNNPYRMIRRPGGRDDGGTEGDRDHGAAIRRAAGAVGARADDGPGP